MFNNHNTINNLQSALQAGKITSVELTQNALNIISDPCREGGKTFISVYEKQAMTSAIASDALREVGICRSSLEGIPISIKDLFDYQGDVTRGGSIILKNSKPATKNATIVQRLINAGAIIVGRTNMTEFAFSGLGINPHYGTPRSPWDRETGRIPGGSSSGAAVSLSDGMSYVAIGTDTGGSIRIPSAFCGLTGFKPTARRISSDGVMPLSHSLDSSGPLANSVECCAITDAILAGKQERELNLLDLKKLRFVLPTNYVLDLMDKDVERAFYAAIEKLAKHGVQIQEKIIPELNELPHINRLGGFVCAEAWYYHQENIKNRLTEYDPRVASRILRGKEQSAADYIDLIFSRKRWIKSIRRHFLDVDAFIMPTVPIVAPTIKELEDEERYFEKNALILRNPTLFNFMDGCALSLPCHEQGEAPVGLMIGAPALSDDRLLDIGYTIEKVV